MNDIRCLQNNFLIAMPSLIDPNFHQAVAYVCEHSQESGAIALVINRVLSVTIDDIFSQMDIQPAADKIEKLSDTPVFCGGPNQQDRGFILHRPPGQWRSSLLPSDELAVTTSKDILEAMANGEGPEDVLVTLGYAGWAPEQLEQEIMDNVWLSCPADSDILFSTPIKARWRAALALLGIDSDSISGTSGHA